MNTVLLPVFRRPEFFYFLAQSIKNARGADRYRYIVAAEHGCDPQFVPLLKDLQASLGCQVQVELRQRRYGLTENILEGLKLAQSLSSEFTIILEEDLMISRDFFEFLEFLNRHFARPDVLSFDGAPQSLIDLGLDPALADSTAVCRGNWYVPLASCIRKQAFEKFLLPHCRREYYDNNEAYLRAQFPQSPLKNLYLRQAGLIERVRHQHQLVTLRPAMPRVRHIGVYGEHTRIREESFLNKSFEEKIAEIEEWIDQPELMNSLGTYKSFWQAHDDHRWECLNLLNPDYICSMSSLPPSVQDDLRSLKV